nr:synaptonemal complex central element protein 1-like isoform X2 [Pongo pygmaeus]
MAGKLKPLNVEAPEAAEEAEGQAKSLKPEDVLAMVIKLQKEGSLEPQIEDLISRINELQQVNGEKVHLEEVLSKKQEALRILQMHCQEKERKAQRLDVKGQLEDLMGQHKDLWEFHMLEQRLAREIRALERSKEQLLSERRLVRAKLGEVERRLRSPPEVEGARAVNDGLKAELEIFGEQVQSAPEVGAGKGEGGPGDRGSRGGGLGQTRAEARSAGTWSAASSRPRQAGPELPRARDEEDPEPPVAAPDAL